MIVLNCMGGEDFANVIVMVNHKTGRLLGGGRHNQVTIYQGKALAVREV